MIGTRARTAGLAESPLLSNGHGGFGKRFGETGRLKDQYRAPNRLRGGKDNFAADRLAAEEVLAVMPVMAQVARSARLFLATVVHHLAAERGIRQFLDIGTGLPTANNAHQVAQRAAPESRIVYADDDPSIWSDSTLAGQGPPRRRNKSARILRFSSSGVLPVIMSSSGASLWCAPHSPS